MIFNIANKIILFMFTFSWLVQCNDAACRQTDFHPYFIWLINTLHKPFHLFAQTMMNKNNIDDYRYFLLLPEIPPIADSSPATTTTRKHSKLNV
jgi:hypothetical protein